jgi:hypothetical protein
VRQAGSIGYVAVVAEWALLATSEQVLGEQDLGYQELESVMAER